MKLYALQTWSIKRNAWRIAKTFDDLEKAKANLSYRQQQGTYARLIQITGKSEVLP